MKDLSEISDIDLPDCVGDVARRILNLKQGNRSVADHSVKFKVLAVECPWNGAALSGIPGLSEQLEDELATQGIPSDLQSVITLAARLENHLKER